MKRASGYSLRSALRTFAPRAATSPQPASLPNPVLTFQGGPLFNRRKWSTFRPALTAPFHAREFTRGTSIDDEEWVVGADFSLESADRDLLRDLVRPDLDLTYQRYVYPQGNTKYGLRPWMPRDLTARDRATQALREAVGDGWLERLDAPEQGAQEPDESTRLHERARVLADELDTQDDWLPDDARKELSALVTGIEGHDPPRGAKGKRSGLLEALAGAGNQENDAPPHQRINEILARKVPEFLLFKEEHRALETEYVWADNPSPPVALANLY